MIHAVASRDGPETHQVQMGILDLERIEGPLHQVKASLQRVIALSQLHAAPQSVIAPGILHRQHVGVQVSATGTRPGNRESKTDQIRAVESSNDLTADLLADDKEPQGNQVHVVETPYLFLQSDACS